MTLLAHLSDTHLLEEGHAQRGAAARRRLRVVSIGRPLDEEARRERLLSSLRHAERARADHVLITGDLTEDGADAQFAVLADVLRASRIRPDRVTLIPGNHDAYVDEDAYARALAGPLADYRATSTPGAVTDLDGVSILAVSTAFHQPYLRSAGRLPQRSLTRIADFARHRPGEAKIVALHHPPMPHLLSVAQWVDGLQEHADVFALLQRERTLHALHGHAHEVASRVVCAGEAPRVFSCAAVVDDPKPVRFYRAAEGTLTALDAPAPRTRFVPAFATTAG